MSDIVKTSHFNGSMEHISDRMKYVEELIVTQSSLSAVPLTQDIIKHIISAGGKRVRPLLCLLSASLFAPVSDHICMTGAALEFIHTATLLHDDVLDNGEKRRGKSTANMVWGNKAAILVGDHLFARAFSLLVKTDNQASLATISRTSEILAEGEIIQLALKNQVPTEEDYFKIISAKTASLFSAACKSGAILAGASSKDIQALNEFGHNFGLTFQLIDDMIDYESSADVMGKNAGDDFFEGKYTLPIIYAYRQSDIETQKNIAKIMSSTHIRNDADFEYIQNIIKKTDALTYVHNYAKKLDYDNRAYLSAFHQNDITKALFDLCDKALYRKA